MCCIWSLPSLTEKLLSGKTYSIGYYTHRWKGHISSGISPHPYIRKAPTPAWGPSLPRSSHGVLLTTSQFKCHFLREVFRDCTFPSPPPSYAQSPSFNPFLFSSISALLTTWYFLVFLVMGSKLGYDLIAWAEVWTWVFFSKYPSVISNVQPDLKAICLCVYWISPNTRMWVPRKQRTGLFCTSKSLWPLEGHVAHCRHAVKTCGHADQLDCNYVSICLFPL